MKNIKKITCLVLCILVLGTVFGSMALANNPAVSNCDTKLYVADGISPRGIPCNCGGTLFRMTLWCCCGAPIFFWRCDRCGLIV